MDQFAVTIDEASSLGRQLLAAIQRAEDYALNHPVAFRDFWLFRTNVACNALLTAFHAATEKPKSRQIGALRMSFGGSSFTQAGDDLIAALGSTQQALIARDHGQLHVMCSDDREAFDQAILDPLKLTELPKTFASTGRFRRIIVNAQPA